MAWAQAVEDLIEQGALAFEACIPILSQLLKAEREVRSIAFIMKAARFPAYRDLSGLDFAASEINEATVRTLHRCKFMEGAQNVVLIGGRGTVKNHVATAIGIQAVSITAEGFAASRPSNWSTPPSRKRQKARPVRSPEA